LYLIGYGLEVTRRVIRHDPRPLPDVAFGESLSAGFKSFIIGVVYGIPMFIIYLPIMIATFMIDPNGDPSQAGPVFTAIALCCGGLMFLYGIVLWIWLPAAQGNFAATDSLGAAFRFKQVFALLKAAPGPYLMVLLGGIIAGIISPLGSIACGVGVVLTGVYAVVMVGHLTGQAYQAAIANKALM
jgi:hypothetical protein